jgi:hypothetical protein
MPDNNGRNRVWMSPEIWQEIDKAVRAFRETLM